MLTQLFAGSSADVVADDQALPPLVDIEVACAFASAEFVFAGKYWGSYLVIDWELNW